MEHPPLLLFVPLFLTVLTITVTSGVLFYREVMRNS